MNEGARQAVHRLPENRKNRNRARKIRDKAGNLTVQNKLSPNFWAFNLLPYSSAKNVGNLGNWWGVTGRHSCVTVLLHQLIQLGSSNVCDFYPGPVLPFAKFSPLFQLALNVLFQLLGIFRGFGFDGCNEGEIVNETGSVGVVLQTP